MNVVRRRDALRSRHPSSYLPVFMADQPALHVDDDTDLDLLRHWRPSDWIGQGKIYTFLYVDIVNVESFRTVEAFVSTLEGYLSGKQGLPSVKFILVCSSKAHLRSSLLVIVCFAHN